MRTEVDSASTRPLVVGILGVARIVAGLPATVWGRRSVYAVTAVLLVAPAGLVLMLLPAEARAGRPGYRQVLRGSRSLFGDRRLLSRGLNAFFLFASFGTLWSGLALPLTASVGSAFGAAATTAAYSAAGWTGSSIAGAAFAVGGFAVWAIADGRRRPADRRPRRSITPATEPGHDVVQTLPE
ncbi:hypothetical protein [Nocardia nova]|uniref:hypothetical protein n=1 Tax=Nocardia nova TaxID=37330 RepID=UPI002738A27F|nr:hypothetical protein [Nocardia nova]